MSVHDDESAALRAVGAISERVEKLESEYATVAGILLGQQQTKRTLLSTLAGQGLAGFFMGLVFVVPVALAVRLIFVLAHWAWHLI